MTALQICNLALSHLGRQGVTTLGVRASGTVTVGTEVANDTVTVAGVAFTLKTSLTASRQILIGTLPADTARSLAAAVNEDPTTSASVVASLNDTAGQVVITAAAAGTGGNAITLAESGSSFTVSGATLSGGVANDGTTEADLLDVYYPLARDRVLLERAWSFALEQYAYTTAADTAPTFGYSGRFYLDSEILRVLEVNDNESEWELQGRYIHSDESALDVLAVSQVTDTTRFSPAFVMALSLRLAADLAAILTESRPMVAELEQRYELELRRAAALDGKQGRSELRTSTWFQRARA